MPEPVIEPRVARTRWANPLCALSPTGKSLRVPTMMLASRTRRARKNACAKNRILQAAST
jgi:hypothetical protein